MLYQPTPFQEITTLPILEKAGVRLFVKREDQNHKVVSGNKFWKLKYNIKAAIEGGYQTILTFGGAFSNHIYSAAAAANQSALKSIGIIRGEQTTPLNPTLQFAVDQEMTLRFVSRSDYKNKMSPESLAGFKHEFGEFFLIPEGGSNLFAIRGCAEFAEQHLANFPFDYIFLPVGTGGTIAGIICGLGGHRKVIGVPVLKQGHFLNDDIKRMVLAYAGMHYDNWELMTDYHHGGYAKTTPELLDLIKEMRDAHDLPLDHVYTAKAAWAIVREITLGNFKAGERILLLHTGGLQGSAGL